ncbi:hypothetical protein IWZ01DRAFT_545742 [Phyllosticta capitalensis]
MENEKQIETPTETPEVESKAPPDDAYLSHRQKAKLFEDLVYDLYNQTVRGQYLAVSERDYVIQQIQLLVHEVKVLTYATCQQIVDDIKQCLAKAMRSACRFEYIKMVVGDIVLGARDLARERSSGGFHARCPQCCGPFGGLPA